MMLFILVAKIFERILYEVLHNEIDLNRSSDKGLFSFGIKARKVELVASPILFFFLFQFNIIFRASFIMSHAAL